MKPIIYCTSGKAGYADEASAKYVLVHLRRKGRDERRTYECARCGYWHLTSMPLADVRRRSLLWRLLHWRGEQ